MIPLGLTFRHGGQASLLCGLAAFQPAPQNCGELFFFFFLLAKAQSRKEIVVHQKKNPLPQFYGTGIPPYKGELTLVLPSKI